MGELISLPNFKNVKLTNVLTNHSLSCHLCHSSHSPTVFKIYGCRAARVPESSLGVKVYGLCKVTYSIWSWVVVFEAASSTLCSQRVVQEPDSIPHLICGPVLKGKASETNNWPDKELILGFMSESLNVPYSSIINSRTSLWTEF